MKKLVGLMEGCSLIVGILVVLSILGGIAVFHAFVTGLPFLQSETQRAQDHIDALQAQHQAWLESPWQPYITGAKAIGTMALYLSPVCALFYVAWKARTKAKFTFPRGDGLWPMRTRDVAANPKLATTASAEWFKVEKLNASRTLPAAHVHVTTAAANQLAADAQQTDAEHAVSPAFADLMADGEFNGNE